MTHLCHAQPHWNTTTEATRRATCGGCPALTACHTLAHAEVAELGTLAHRMFADIWAGYTLAEHAAGQCCPHTKQSGPTACPGCGPRRYRERTKTP